jgi:hypothetical protein
MKTSFRRWGLTVAALGCSVLLAGCGGAGGLARVNGKVSYKGKAVTAGNITFSPLDDKGGKFASGTVKSDGTFALTTNTEGDGAAIGKHKVTYAPGIPSLAEGKTLKPGESSPANPYAGLVPVKKEVEVTSGTNDIEIELTPGK